MEEVEWRDVPGYEGYQATACGRIRTKDRVVRWVNPNGETTCNKRGKELKLTMNEDGYLRFTTRINGVGSSLSAHRAVALAFIPNPENKATVNHKDGNKSNNHVSNLEWCTLQENLIHAYSSPKMRLSKGRRIYTDEIYIQVRDRGKWTVTPPFPPFNGMRFMCFDTEEDAKAVKRMIYKLTNFDKLDKKYKAA